MSLQAFSNVTLEDVAVFGECCPCRGTSLNLIVSVFVSSAVFMSHVGETWAIWES